MTWEVILLQFAKLCRRSDARRFVTALPVMVLLSAVPITSFSAQPQQIRSNTLDQSISADLAFNFECKGEASQEFDEVIERFLMESSFEVLNVPRLRRERKMAPLPAEVRIDGVDDSQRMIRIASGGLRVGSYFLHLFSPPPTHHAEALEKQLLTLISDMLGCRGPENRAFYDEVFRARQKSFRELK